MAGVVEYARLLLEWLVRLFHRFLWSAGDLPDLERKAVFITGQSLTSLVS